MDTRVESSLISLRVHRVVPRNDGAISHFLTEQELVNYFTLDEDFASEEKSLIPEYSNDWRFVPKAYVQVYLGETFRFHVKALNDSEENLTEITLTLDLKKPSNVVDSLGELKFDCLSPKQFIHGIYQHEIKELGAYHLFISDSYKTVNSVKPYIFRRSFKFLVDKPFEVDARTKSFNNEGTEVMLEAQLKNLTSLPMCLDSMRLEPSPYFHVECMDQVTSCEGTRESVFGPVNRLDPTNIRSYLFRLLPREECSKDVKQLLNVTDIGKLDIMWTSSIGSKGRLQTTTLERERPNCSDIHLAVIKSPSEALLKRKFDLILKFTNCCDYPIEPFVHFEKLSEGQPVVWLGISGKSLGKLKPAESIDVKMTAYPIRLGLWPIPSLRLSDPHLQANFSFKDVAYVFIRDT